MATDAEILQQAQATLARAILELYPGLTVSRESFANVLGLVWGENKFGTTSDWQDSNNWGSLRCYRQDYGCIQHGDRDAQGKPIVVPFQRYPSQLEGAKGFLRTLLKTPAERAALSTGRPLDLARALYEAGYYTGTKGTPEERIQSKAALIQRGANTVKSILGSSLGRAVMPGSNTGVILAGLVALGAGIWYYLRSPSYKVRLQSGRR